MFKKAIFRLKQTNKLASNKMRITKKHTKIENKFEIWNKKLESY